MKYNQYKPYMGSAHQARYSFGAMQKSQTFEDGGKAIRVMRESLGWTQAETARLLGVSRKSVESYEQGCRHPPKTLCKQMITLLALQKGYLKNWKPCWEVVPCPTAVRDACFCARKMNGTFCWLTSSDNCDKHRGEQKTKPASCFQCPVVQQFM